MECEIILENGEKVVFFLREDEIRKLEHKVKRANECNRDLGWPESCCMADEMRWAVKRYIKGLPDPAQKYETPAAATAGESR